MLTVGVEEEFLLLWPSGAVAPVAAEAIRWAGVEGAVKPEFMAYQVETSTDVCTHLDEVHRDLVSRRAIAAAGARRVGAYLVASGVPPFRHGAIGRVSEDPRYAELARRFPRATAAGGACACQIHVGVPDRDLRVEVLARLRPWLPTLLALTANSPVVDGSDSGWDSWRYRALLHWPTFQPPGRWTDAAVYDRVVGALVACGVAVDPGSVYFLARLSARYPTVEVRVADACLDVADALLLAGVVRSLVTALVEDALRGQPMEPVASTRVRASLIAVAHHGVRAAFDALRERLLDKIKPALAAAGDLAEVERGLDRIGHEGTGAQRQRRLWSRTNSPAAFVAALAETTAPALAYT